ncbi:MAG TPA: di-heme oxidoredictase family protein [Bryobacteraceae bacterium]|nr:di-heme oxidoredictase family protein [Bryobacteraceae bacterium]
MARLTNTLLLLTLSTSGLLLAQIDPGPGRGPQGPGPARPLAGLNANELAWFNEGADRFREVDSVSGTQPGAPGSGLGPRFNGNSCSQCHAHPVMGGSSPILNPQVELATAFGASNRVPAFIQQNGPVRVVRFVRNPDGSPDGGVHDLFTITGRSDAPGCTIPQPDFDAAVRQNNAIFRIPTPVLGGGLLEAISEAAIMANLAADAPQKQKLGIRGRENRNGNDGTITRFGWKAQNKSLLLFAGEAYNVEQGVSNEIFPNEREEAPGCATNPTPEDHTHPDENRVLSSISDLTGIMHFMKFSAPPPPSSPQDPSVQRGADAFSQIGCALCHTPVLQSGNAGVAALRNKPVALYSDLSLHNMGTALNDGINQGRARGADWRTAPLWGLGARLFFLHDGRTQDLAEAIRFHASRGSEANQVVDNYNALSADAKQDLLNFLRSL